MFQRVSAHKQWIIGSLESDTGSEYLFGFDPEQGLMWLERPGHEYASSDQVWKEAESYIRSSSLTVGSVNDMMTEGTPSTALEDQYVVPVSPSNGERPRTVTRSAAGDTSNYPQPGDPRIVGDMSLGSIDASDEDIAAQAAEFLMNLGEE